MNNDIRLLDPLSDPDWDERILTHAQGSFFLTSGWARVLADSYGYLPRYFGVVRSGALEALVPFMEVNSFLTGKRGVSLPFTDQCEPITCAGTGMQDLLDQVIDHGKRSGWNYLELRPGTSLAPDTPPSTSCFGHVLDLTPGQDRLFRGLRDSTRRNIKRAQNAGITLAVSRTEEGLREFCRLNCLTRREHGLPPQPAKFFGNIARHVLAKGRGMVVLASSGGQTIAGAVYFHFGGTAVYKYGASDRHYQHLRANNLVMWEAIQRYAADGLRRFDFGRTEPGNEGLLQFKRGWGAAEQAINYYRYDLRRDRFVAKSLAVAGAHTTYFRHMPMPLLKLAGTLLYRHMG
jgi:hypothetical protein